MTFALHVLREVIVWGVVGALIISAAFVIAIAVSNDRNHRRLSRRDW